MIYKIKSQILILVISTFVLSAFATDKPAYLLYSKNGKKIKYKKVLRELQQADVVFFGEQHTNPISHWLQFEMANDLHSIIGSNLIIGGEMFETDNQLIINEYLNGLISEQRFESEARLWENYQTDYKPLLILARENNLPFFATNIPRRYASVVFKLGFPGLDSLSAEARKYIAPLPIHYDPNLPVYKKMITMSHVHKMDANVSFFPQAQAIKDATMAWFIQKNYMDEKLFFHMNGSYHSDHFEGIIWHLQKYRPELNVKTITTVEQEDVTRLNEENKKADFIIVVHETMTKTH